MKSKAISKEESRELFLSHCKALALYWAQQKGSKEQVCDGLVFSILSTIDGCTELPAIDLALSPHPEDKQYCVDNEEDWFEPGLVINDDCDLHDLYMGFQ